MRLTDKQLIQAVKCCIGLEEGACCTCPLYKLYPLGLDCYPTLVNEVELRCNMEGGESDENT